MADEEDESEETEPAVELGEGATVEGAPLARVASRLKWGIKRSAVREEVGDVQVRTPEGPRALADLLDEVDVPYFESRQEFLEATREAAGSGPVPTTD
jgi:hypothetical protein